MRHLFNRRILFFGGKGGVGKTTCSSALALAASGQGKRVLLVSTDPAHSTSDIFERAIGAGREVSAGLDAIEIDPEAAARQYVEEAKERLAGLFSPGVVRAAARQIDLAAGMPGVADAALFDRMAQIMVTDAQRYDLVVFDTAPTGHSLRLLRMPELLAAWVDALARRRAEAREAEEAARGGRADARDEGRDEVLALLRQRAARLDAVRTLLGDGGQVGFVLVLIPERLPIEETARAAHLLEETGVAVAGLVVNRVLPAAADGRFFEARKAQERTYLSEIDRRFSAFPRVSVPQLEADVHDRQALEEIGRYLLPGGREGFPGSSDS